MYQLKYFIRNFFGFNQRETNGFIVVCLILFFLLFVPSLLSKYYPSQRGSTKEDDQKKLSILLATVKEKESSIISKEEVQVNSYKNVDPNTAEFSDLKSLVGTKLANTIINFRSKGGRFKTKEDLKKIYGMDERLYSQIQIFIVIPNTDKKNVSKALLTISSTFDINKADTLQLESLKGIGRVLATRIIKYRTKLGGFITKAQFKEVYGLDSLVLWQLEKKTFIDIAFVPVKISINKSAYEPLASHPYINRKNAGVIINYRKNHGEFTSLEEMKNIIAIPEEALAKMKPYLSL